MFTTLKKGFTLIELLVVIAIMAVIASAVLVGINPADKINAANDSKVQSDLSQISTSVSSYTAQESQGRYPTGSGDATFVGTGKELAVWPTQPSGYSAYLYTVAPAGCNNVATNCTSAVVTGQLKSNKYTATPFQRWESTTGKVCQVLTAATACP